MRVRIRFVITAFSLRRVPPGNKIYFVPILGTILCKVTPIIYGIVEPMTANVTLQLYIFLFYT